MPYIHLPEPCSQSWQEMTPVAQGRFCGQCCKTVIDFSSWEPADILVYLRQYPTTCGRFRKAQLDVAIPEPEWFVTRLNRSPFSFQSRIALIIVFVVAVMAGSCTSGTQQAPPATQHNDSLPAPHTLKASLAADSQGLPPVPPPPLKSLNVAAPAPPQIVQPVIMEPQDHLGGAPVVIEEPEIAVPLPPPADSLPPKDSF